MGENEDMFCSDDQNMQIAIISAKGKEVGTIGKFGHKPAEFNGIKKVIVSPSGLLYVLEKKNYYTSRIETYHIYLKRYRQDGTFLGRVRIPGEATHDYMFDTIQSIAAAPDGSIYLSESNVNRKICRIIKYQPAYYKPQGKTGRIVGKIQGVKSEHMKYMTIWIEGVQDGIAFYGSVRPNAKGKYKITKFPIGVDFIIRLIGHNTMKYECEEIRGLGAKVVKKQNLMAKAK